MKRLSKNQECNIHAGTVISGKWNHNHYLIIKRLGSGATGTVYLAQSKNGLAALKIGNNSLGITSEVNILKRFSKVQGKSLGPSFIDMDDWIKDNECYPFYVMDYMRGEPFIDFLKTKNKEWLGILIIQLLNDLDHLHKAGWVFGDLKPDNLLVVGPPPKVCWIDVGGTTLIGRSIKEYTEFFDRGYWGLGSRKAEPSYDLFSTAMIIINAFYPERFEKKGDGITQLERLIRSNEQLNCYKSIIMNALKGKYNHAAAMRQDMIHTMQRRKSEKTRKGEKVIKNPPVKKENKQIKKSFFRGMETLVIVALILFLYILYLINQ
ncbi:protein kinase domain-containing protein [Bacillus taeanensis]|uniref:Protein kinase family protein n=1 Tax=Bacillus taeanensis TaxID=273032 RepID=A0A366XU29_9BACI|nr:serine/threonine-protein kinase [Bacillus taeanensis]RBW67653.1 protein kinase family protein [Bacillus taeanensis]